MAACQAGEKTDYQGQVLEEKLSLDSLLATAFKTEEDWEYLCLSEVEGKTDTMILDGEKIKQRFQPYLSKASLNKPAHLGQYAVSEQEKKGATTIAYRSLKKDFIVDSLFLTRNREQLMSVRAHTSQDYRLYQQSYAWQLALNEDGRLEELELSGTVDHSIASGTLVRLWAKRKH